MTKEIRVDVRSAGLLRLEQMYILQDDLKSLSKSSYEHLKAEILEHGFSFAIHVWQKEGDSKYGILDGTQRFRVVSQMVSKEGYSIEGIPVNFVTASSEKEAVLKLLGAAGAYGKPEDEGLYALMMKHHITLNDIPNIELPGIDLPSFGDEYFNDPETEGEDDVPSVPEQSHVRLGDVFILGIHRLLCGDSTDSGQVARLMNGEKADLWSSDPPYGINHVDVSQEKNQSTGYHRIENDDLQFDELKSFLEKVIRNFIQIGLNDNFAFYMWHAMKMQSYAAAAAAAGVLFHRQIIWVKPSLVFGRGHYHWRHELCLMGWLQGNEPPFYGERNQTTVWNIGRENDKIHPTQKPVEITEIPIKNHTRQGAGVIDPFLGSGSTLIACEKTNRKCFGLEIDPLYVSVILDRWEKFTGKSAVREDGKPWSEIKTSA